MFGSIPVVWPRWLLIWCVAIVLLLIPFGSIQRDFWTDEVFTASYTTHPTISLLLDDVRKNEETPPAYFVVTWLWARLFGHNEIALRALSFLCGICAFVAFIAVARRYLAPIEAAIASIVFAGIPMVARYMIEARGYTMLLLLAVLCIAAFERLYRKPENPTALITYVLVTATLFLTSYFSVALIAAHNLIWAARLLRRPLHWRRQFVVWLAAQLAMALIVLPWLPSLLYQMQVAPAVSPFKGARPEHYGWLLLMLLMFRPPSTLWFVVWLLLAVAFWGTIVVGLRHSFKSHGGLIVRAFGVPALVLFGLIVWMQAIGPRYMLVVLPGALLALAVGCGWLWRRAPRVAAASCAICVVALVVYRIFGAATPISGPTSGSPWRDIIPHIAQRVDSAHDVILFQPPYEQRTFEYYYSGPPLKLLGAHDYDTLYYDDPSHDLLTGWTSTQALAVTNGSRRVWVVYDQISQTVPRLQLPYVELAHWRSNRLELFLYEVSSGR